MKIIGTCIPVLDTVEQLSIEVNYSALDSTVKRVLTALLRFRQWPIGWTEDITIDEAYALWQNPDMAADTKVRTFGDFVERDLKPRGYRVI